MEVHLSPDHALVLVVEDNPVARLILAQQLQRWGFAVAEAEDGESAVERLGAPGGPRIVLLDWMLPGIAGTEVCRRVREAPIVPQPHIIMLTSRDAVDDVVTGLRAGADDYVVKPPVPAELQARLSVAVRVTRLQGELAARVRELEAEKAHVRELREILPICSVCRRIRDDVGGGRRAFRMHLGLFRRLHAQSVYPGTGLGLAIAKLIVDVTKGASGWSPNRTKALPSISRCPR